MAPSSGNMISSWINNIKDSKYIYPSAILGEHFKFLIEFLSPVISNGLMEAETKEIQ